MRDAANESVQSYRSDGPIVTFTMAQATLAIELCGPGIARVRTTPRGAQPKHESFAVITRETGPVELSLDEADSSVVIRTDRMRISVGRRDGDISFADAAGNTFLREAAGTRIFDKTTVLDENTYHVGVSFESADPDEAIYGLGQHQQGILNHRGHRVQLAQFNMEVAVPMFISTAGYGLLWDNASESVFDDTGRAKGAPFSLWSEVGECIDYYVFHGPEPDEIIADFRQLTGSAPLFPRWAYGLFQCKERYRTQQELLAIVQEYRDRGVPLDCIVQDWRYWDPYQWGSHRFDPERFPDPAGMMKQLHERLHCALMISVWPRFHRGSENNRQMRKNGYLYREYLISTPRSSPWQEAGEPEAYYDAFDEGARRMYWNQLNNWLFTKGIDAWWLDATEPELNYLWEKNGDRETVKEYMCGCMSGARTRNAFPLMTTRAVYEGQRAYTESKRVYILTRSAFAGQQRHAATTWSGDIDGTWEVFRKQIAGGLSFCFSGIPYWTTDIGGFFVRYEGGCENEEYRELFVRWYQFGAFCPIFRVHGTSTPREIWRFGEPGDTTYDTQLAFDRLRYRLLPYVYSNAWQVTSAGYTMMRGLAFDFRDDPNVADIDDQYMFGPALMACPVTEHKARSRTVYLPAGTAWYDFWTGERRVGGMSIEADAPLERMPVFVRAGAIVPMGPELQYTGEKPADPLELRVYPGADGSFVLYEDAGDSYDYETGAYSTIPIAWNDKTRTLTVGDRSGGFAGMLPERTVRVVVVGEGHGTAIESASRADRELRYGGSAVAMAC